jgi:hypothetical protein
MSTVKIQDENTFLNACRNGLNLVLGAGFSVGALDEAGRALPVGDALANELVASFPDRGIQGLGLADIAAVLNAEMPDEFREFLVRRFTVSKFNTEYKSLFKLKIGGIYTTNIDDLVPRLYAECPDSYLLDLDLRGPNLNGMDAVQYVALHGCVSHEYDNFDFTKLDTASTFTREADRWSALVRALHSKPILFWGHNLADPGVLQALAPSTSKGKETADRWFVLRKEDSKRERVLKALGFRLVFAETTELLTYFDSVGAKDESGVPHVLHKNKLYEKFPDLKVPVQGEYSQRSIAEFYSGEEPAWNDAYSPLVPRTSHYRSAQEAILGKKNVVLLGIPGSGKTTLLMQLAVSVPFDGLKLFTGNLTPERAKLLVKMLYGKQCLLFMDNVADSADALHELTSQSNIQFVCADREYNFDLVSDKVPVRNRQLLNITDLADSDVQEILKSIPNALKSKRPRKIH